jgi:septal ring factor EnvC (AmiA/AmiB activator)
MPPLLLKLLPYARAYWKEIAIVSLALMVFGKMQYDHRLMVRLYEDQAIALQEQIDGLNAIHEEELRLKEEAFESYRSTLEALEKNYLEEQERNNRTITERRRTIERQFSQNKEELANEIISSFNFEYVPM